MVFLGQAPGSCRRFANTCLPTTGMNLTPASLYQSPTLTPSPLPSLPPDHLDPAPTCLDTQGLLGSLRSLLFSCRSIQARFLPAQFTLQPNWM